MSFQHPSIVRTLKGHKDVVTSVAFHPSPSDLMRRKQTSKFELEQIASSSRDGILMLWNCQPDYSELRAFRLIGHTGPINHLCYSPTGRLLASCSSDKTVRLWIPKRCGESFVLKGHSGAVRSLDFSNQESGENSVFVTCSDDKTLKLWNLPNKKFRTSLVGHNNWVRSCNFSPDSKFILSGSDDATMKLWDVHNGDNVVTYKFPSSIATSSSSTFETTIGIRHIRFHPLGNLFGASGSNGNVHLYDLRSDKIVHSLPEINSPLSLSLDLSFHPDGNYLLTSNIEGSFNIWDLRNWGCNLSISDTKNCGATESVTKSSCCSFSKNGMNFVTSGMDKRIEVWKSNFGKIKIDHRSQKRIPSRKQTMQKLSTDNTDNNETFENERVELKYRKNVKIRAENELSEPTVDTLSTIMAQLELVTNKMVIIEKRLSILEQAVMRET